MFPCRVQGGDHRQAQPCCRRANGLVGDGPNVSEEMEPVLSSSVVGSAQKDAKEFEDLRDGKVAGGTSGQWEQLVTEPRGWNVPDSGEEQ